MVSLAVVDDGADLPPSRSVRVDDPDVGVLHRGLEVGEAALRAEEDDLLPVRREPRLVLGALRGVMRRMAPLAGEMATRSWL